MTITGTVILALVIAGTVVGAFFLLQYLRSQRLKGKFGPEYDRAVEATGSRQRAEAKLADRERRVRSFRIHALNPTEREPFRQDWSSIQLRFADEPIAAVTLADQLIGKLMSARGYPMESFEQSSADLSVDHPRVVDHYREGHEVVLRHTRGQASTEDLRRAMIHYRVLFEDLLEEPVNARAEAVRYQRPA